MPKAKVLALVLMYVLCSTHVIAGQCDTVLDNAGKAQYNSERYAAQFNSDQSMVSRGTMDRESKTAQCAVLNRMYGDGQRAMNYANEAANAYGRARFDCDRAMAAKAAAAESSMKSMSDTMRSNIASISRRGSSIGCNGFY